jgi:hypothetical protein
MSDPDRPVSVFDPADFLQADAIRQALNDEGIFVLIENESLFRTQSAFGNHPIYALQIIVRQRDADRAREIINSRDWPTYT